MKKTCMTCEDRDKCTELCADVEAEVSQDHVPLMELRVADPEYSAVDWPEDIQSFNLTKTEAKIQILIEKYFSRVQVAYVLDLSVENIAWHLFNIRKKTK